MRVNAAGRFGVRSAGIADNVFMRLCSCWSLRGKHIGAPLGGRRKSAHPPMGIHPPAGAGCVLFMRQSCANSLAGSTKTQAKNPSQTSAYICKRAASALFPPGMFDTALEALAARQGPGQLDKMVQRCWTQARSWGLLGSHGKTAVLVQVRTFLSNQVLNPEWPSAKFMLQALTW